MVNAGAYYVIAAWNSLKLHVVCGYDSCTFGDEMEFIGGMLVSFCAGLGRLVEKGIINGYIESNRSYAGFDVPFFGGFGIFLHGCTPYPGLDISII